MTSDLSPSERVAARFVGLLAEYDRALDMILAGRRIPMTDRLRHALQRVATKVQGTLNDGATLTRADLAMLCAAEATQSVGEWSAESRNDLARILFEWSKKTWF